MHFIWRPDWTRHAEDFEGYPRPITLEVRDDNLAALMHERQMLCAFRQALVKLSACSEKLGEKETTRRHAALRRQAARFADFENIHGSVQDDVDPALDDAIIFHRDAMPDAASLSVGHWRAAIVVQETWIEARQILAQGPGAVDVHDMMLGAAIERRQRQLEAKVERHMDAHQRKLGHEDHVEASLAGERVRIVILPPPPKRTDYPVD
ncbi:MAG: hypothetical protein QM769_06915 [Pseudoxanthomonas sp.]